ncbi:helix-turn-helix domain-containing protein [Natronobacterium gregoryi]|uniref:Bacterio-opsin activator n=2 Tax=Natronobacterium gregoryi TaxID=44930 RepID=L0AH51_NATGS|nr:helix-turn-helix domain-containing protein [Natronobacterium gregoryi]AFZ73223.1 putative DNA binding protein [Natronobacterium gregoryi SP2]PLK21631.1 bacterio-opsin activator [Natronobacterium gregoryi SP2]SFI58064.1 Predicted DNA binding protein, contains HTH domain [Natronobacterium gregoryi]
MATEATFTLPADRFPLGSVFEQLPDATIELERVIPSRDALVPYFWVRGVETDGIEEFFADQPEIRRIELVDSVEDEHLLRVEWASDHDGILHALTETDVPLVEAVGTDTQWTFDVRGDDRSDIVSFQQRCRELDVPITLRNLHPLTPTDSTVEAVLTEPQREALVLAFDRGYFDSPRAVTMEELGDELGISQQAVASRLWRGIDQLLATTLPETTRRPEA